MSAPAALVRLVEPWSSLYSDSKLLPTVVVFAHIAALVLAGGFAVTLDRATLRAARGSSDMRARQLTELGAAHRLVVSGLALSVVTGVLLFTADLETYFTSRVFWLKATMVVLLLANGFWMTRVEESAHAPEPEVAEAAWPRLRAAAIVSMVLWGAIAFAGVALVKAV